MQLGYNTLFGFDYFCDMSFGANLEQIFQKNFYICWQKKLP